MMGFSRFPNLSHSIAPLFVGLPGWQQGCRKSCCHTILDTNNLCCGSFSHAGDFSSGAKCFEISISNTGGWSGQNHLCLCELWLVQESALKLLCNPKKKSDVRSWLENKNIQDSLPRQSCLLSFSFPVMWEVHKTGNSFNPRLKEIPLVVQPRQKEVWKKVQWPTGIQMWSVPSFWTFAQPRDHHISVKIFHLLMPCFPRSFIKSVMKCSHLAHSMLPRGKGEGKLEPRMQSKSRVFLGMILQTLQWKERNDVFPTFVTSLNHSWPLGIATKSLLHKTGMWSLKGTC